MKNQIRTKTEPKELDEKHQRAVERLRNSKARLPDELRSAGHAAGREFVLENNIADALCHCRLKIFNDEGREFEKFYFFADELLRGTDQCDSDFASDFAYWNGAEVHTPQWIDGFIKGAVEKFEELEKHL